jgi:Sulfotransferase domain
MTQRLPDFVIIGAQKAGTTWLGSRLLEQRAVFLPRPLETHFFDNEENYAKGVDWYASHFAGAPAATIVGEKTPDYFWTTRPEGRGPRDIPARMHRILPQAKLIVVLRDPVKRAISALNHHIRARRLSPFVDSEAVLTESLDPARDRFGLIGRGHYLTHLTSFLNLYPREGVRVVYFEDDIIKAPQQTIKDVMSFLGRSASSVPQSRSRPENSRIHSRLGLVLNYYAPKLSPLVSALDRILPSAPAISPGASCEARLREHFEPHNEALFKFLGRRAETWAIP